MFDPGRANRRITIQKPTESRDGVYGQKVLGWTTVATVWAEYLSGGKNLNNENPSAEANKVISSRRARFIIRYSTDVSAIDEKYRIAFEGDVYEVSDLHKDSFNGYIRIDTEYKAEQVTT